MRAILDVLVMPEDRARGLRGDRTSTVELCCASMSDLSELLASGRCLCSQWKKVYRAQHVETTRLGVHELKKSVYSGWEKGCCSIPNRRAAPFCRHAC